MRIFYGSFLSAYEALAAGADGWISGVLNVVCPTALQMFQALRVEHDMQAAFELWKEILAFRSRLLPNNRWSD